MELLGGLGEPCLSQQDVGLLTGPSLLPEQPVLCGTPIPGPPPAAPALPNPSILLAAPASSSA